MVALGSTTFSLPSFALTRRLSRETTATIEKSAPLGFQHLVQPQTWLWALWPLIATVTGSLLHRHVSVPPSKPCFAGLMPLSTAGWIETLAMVLLQKSSPSFCYGIKPFLIQIRGELRAIVGHKGRQELRRLGLARVLGKAVNGTGRFEEAFA